MPWPNGYTYKRTVSFDHTQAGTTDSTNFPGLIGNQGALAYLATVANGGKINNTVSVNGVTVPADLIFTSDSAGTSLLAWEVARYDATTGAIEIWVKLPTLNHLTTDTVIYMWYGQAAVTTYQCTFTDTWDSNFAAVYHGGDGTTLSLKDSTVNANHLTNHGATPAAGQIAGGFGLVSASSQYLDAGSGSSLNVTGHLTVEAWINFNGTFGAAFPRILSKLTGSAFNGYEFLLDPSPLNNIFLQVGNAGSLEIVPGIGDPQPAISASTWYYTVGSFDGGFGRYFQDGALIATHAFGFSPGSTGQALSIGRWSGGASNYWDGTLDEIRISSIERGPDWVLASYNNQKSSSTFVTIGAEDVSNIQPGGLASAFAAGTPSVLGQILPAGLPSGFVSGLPSMVELNTIFPAGLPTGIAVGVPLIGGGAILPTGVPSGEATGTPAILLQQIVEPDGLPSAFVSGLPSVHHSQTVQPSGLPSAEATGTPYILGASQKIVPGGLPPGLAGVPLIRGGGGGMQIYIANVDRTSYLRMEATSIQSQTIGRANATFDLVVLNGPDYAPALGQTVILVDYGNKIFAGCLNSVINELQPYTATVVYHCQAVDKTSICDHRVINKTYAAGTDAADVVRDIVNNALNGEGITTQGVPPSIAALSSDLICTFYTVTQAFDAITNDVGGIWWIDFNGVLYFTPLSSLPACPLALSEFSDNWQFLTVEETLLGYRNKQYSVSNLNVLPGTGNSSGSGPPVVTETYTLPQAAAVARAFYFGGIVLNYSTVQILSLKVNGVAQPVHGGLEAINFQKSWWYFAGDPYITPPNAANNNPYYPYPPVISAYPVAGDVVEISYIPVAQNAAVSAGTPLAPLFGTCGSGVYEAVEQVQNISFQGDLDAISAKILAKYSQIPKILKFKTYWPGVAVGQLITVDLPKNGLPSTTLFITSVTGQSYGENLGKGSTMEWTVEAATNVDLGNWMKWFERLVAQTENPLPVNQYEDPNWVLGPGGSVSAGVVDTNPYEVKRTGKLIAATFVATTPPVDQDMYIDLQTQNGSIFSSPMKIPAGTLAFQKVTWTQFFNDPGMVGYPSYLTKGDIFRPPIVTYAVTGANPTAAGNATVALIWQI